MTTAATTTQRLKDDVERVHKYTALAVEPARDETACRVKRRPLSAVAVAFGAGAILGLKLAIIGRGRTP